MSINKPVPGVMVRYLLLILLLLCLCSPSLCYAKHHNATGSCKAGEKRALLQFKRGLFDPRGMLASWEGDDCCRWRGVRCDQSTGNVIRLNLRCNPCRDRFFDVMWWDDRLGLQGQFGTSLLHLKYLERLDVSGNDFMHSHIPNTIDSLNKLKHLDLSMANFSGSVPSQLGNLTSLRYLDLSYDNFIAETINWVSHLTHLRYIDMTGCKFEDNTTNILQELNVLPFISQVYLRRVSLELFPSLHGHINFTVLSTLDLFGNQLISIPSWLPNITSLQHLNLSFNYIKDGIFTILGSLCKLKSLDASTNDFVENLSTSNTNLSHCASHELEMLHFFYNNFTGFLPDWLAKHQKLKILDLSSNKFYGQVPEHLGLMTSLQNINLAGNNLSGNIPLTIVQLKNLSIFDVSYNQLQGTLSEMHFSNLADLTFLDLSSNSFELDLSHTWKPPFHIETLNLKSCKMGSHFPLWLQTQDSLVKFSFANTGISGILPTWIWNFSSHLEDVNLADNNLFGSIPDQLSLDSSLAYVNLSSNGFEGLLPHFNSRKLQYLDLSNNSFYGPMSQINSGPMTTCMNFFSVALNNLNGTIPSSICKWRDLSILDFSTNHLIGVLPDCLKRLTVLNAASNQINGSGFISTTSLCELHSLHLNNNNLYGSFPLSLQSCKQIKVLDLGENKINGVIPDWLPDSFPYLRILCLRGNLMWGNIPSNLPHMSSLQVIDLADNNLFGNIPKNFGNFSSMKYVHDSEDNFLTDFLVTPIYGYLFLDFIVLNIKKRTMVFNNLLPLVASIDLSRNKLSSEIPTEMENLKGLYNLNLSQNCLTGRIPKELSKLQRLESLDLSQNNLSGEIPTSLTALTFLSYLNLSFNNLSGIIPISNQFSTFIDKTLYTGNPYLCGVPLDPCEQASNHTGARNVEKGDGEQNKNKDAEYEIRWLMMGIVFGFIFGFWLFYGSLILKKSWKHAYYKLTHAWCDQLYIMIQLNLHRLRRIFRENQY